MTSTNDGKEVKSNETSSQKGKTYLIELHKSLDTRLSQNCNLRARSELLKSAWHQIHTLCLHSTPNTHPYLLNWIQRHTAKTVLQTEWQSPKTPDIEAIQGILKDGLCQFIQECETAAHNRKLFPWETQLLGRAQWFKSILPNPWGHPVLRVLLDPRGAKPTDEEILEWLKEEQGVMFVCRVRQLSSSKSVSDLALLLAAAVMARARVGQKCDDLGEGEVETVSEGTTFKEVLTKEAGFTEDVWELLIDIEFVLLHKNDRRDECIELAKQTPFADATKLVERLQNKLTTSPREKKLWKNAKEVAILVAQVVLARCMVVPVCVGACRAALLGAARVLGGLLPADRLSAATAALAARAATARHLHSLARALDAQCGSERKSFVCELYVRAITAGMNELEQLKLNKTKDLDARAAEQTLAAWFTQLGSVLTSSARIKCECILTAFSVHPSPVMFERIKTLPQLQKSQEQTQEQQVAPSEFGSWASDSRSQTNFVKTSETLNIKQTHQGNVLSTALLSEGEALGLAPELCQDLAVLLSGPRIKTLSWEMDREKLLENCRTYMERTNCGTRALTTELKYLNLDPKTYQHLPEEAEDADDMYYGIEKGYEHLVEFRDSPPPEAVWQRMSDFEQEKSDSNSNQDSDFDVPKSRSKKKSKKQSHSSSDEAEPLSLAEIKEMKKKERPHSKERSQERKKTIHQRSRSQSKEKHTKETKKDNSQSKERKKEKKKEKRGRKKREKPIPVTNNVAYSSSLAQLIGSRVVEMENQKSPIFLNERPLHVPLPGPSDDPLRPSTFQPGYNDAFLAHLQARTLNSPVPPMKPQKKRVKTLQTKIRNIVGQHVTTPRNSPMAQHASSTVPRPFSIPRQSFPMQYNASTVKPAISTPQHGSPGHRNASPMPRYGSPTPRYASPTPRYASPPPRTDSPIPSPKLTIPQNVVYQKPISDEVKQSINRLLQFRRPKASPPKLNTDTSVKVTEAARVQALQAQMSFLLKHELTKPDNKNKEKPTEFFQEFIKSLQTTGHTKPNDIDQKSLNPINKVTAACTSMQQKKVENAPNTFARLSYMHKNKQENCKSKPSESKETLENINKLSLEIDRLMSSQKLSKLKHLQSQGIGNRNTPNMEVRKTLETTHRINSETVTSASNSISATVPYQNLTNVGNTIQHSNVSTTSHSTSSGSSLSRNDQAELLMLLRQQNKLNAISMPQKNQPKHVVPPLNNLPLASQRTAKPSNNLFGIACYNPAPGTTKKSTSLSTEGVTNIVNSPITSVTEPTLPKTEMLSVPNILKKTTGYHKNQQKEQVAIKPKTDSAIVFPKSKSKEKPKLNKLPKSRTQKRPENWECVLNQLLAQKTPNRETNWGPNALDMALKKDTYKKPESKLTTSVTEKANATPIIIKNTTVTAPSVNTYPIATKTDMHQVSPRDIKKVDNKLAKSEDPFISGIPKSDYDLLEELMDEDLRKEIGEISSDEEGFSQTIEKSNKEVSCAKQSVRTQAKDIELCQKTTVRPSKQSSNRILDSNTLNRNILVTSLTPRPAVQNMLVIGNEITYDRVQSINVRDTNASYVVPTAYVAMNNPSNVSLYQTQQIITAPLMNSIILGQAVTIPVQANITTYTPLQINISGTHSINQISGNSSANTNMQATNMPTPQDLIAGILQDNTQPNKNNISSSQQEHINLNSHNSTYKTKYIAQDNEKPQEKTLNQEMPVQHDTNTTNTNVKETKPLDDCQTVNHGNGVKEPKALDDCQILNNGNMNKKIISEQSQSNINAIEVDKSFKCLKEIVNMQPREIQEKTFNTHVKENSDMISLKDRKVLSAVPEKLKNATSEKTDSKIVVIQKNFESADSIKNQERIKQKRLAILNRQLLQKSCHPCISLDYAPLTNIFNLHESSSVLESTEVNGEIENDYALTPDSQDDVENKSQELESTKDESHRVMTCRRILLRSSNVLKEKIIDSSASVTVKNNRIAKKNMKEKQAACSNVSNKKSIKTPKQSKVKATSVVNSTHLNSAEPNKNEKVTDGVPVSLIVVEKNGNLRDYRREKPKNQDDIANSTQEEIKPIEVVNSAVETCDVNKLATVIAPKISKDLYSVFNNIDDSDESENIEKTKDAVNTWTMRCADVLRDHNVQIQDISHESVNPNVKLVKVKLPTGKSLRVTIIGSKTVDYDTILTNPVIKKFVNDAIKGCNLKKQMVLQLIPKQKENFKSFQVVETVDLLSDEEPENNTLNTEFGSFIVTNLNSEDCIKHQRKLSQNCFVKIKRFSIDSFIELIIDKKPENDANLSSGTKTIEFNIVENKLKETMNTQSPVIIEIDDSTDEECLPNSVEKISEYKNMILNDLQINKSPKQTRQRVRDNSNLGQNCIDVKLNRKCYVKLVRCDTTLIRADNNIDAKIAELNNIEAKIFEDDSEENSSRPSSRNSFSILYDVPLLSPESDNKASYGLGRSSPVLEAFEQILNAPNVFNLIVDPTVSEELVISEPLFCHCEYFQTKKISSLLMTESNKNESTENVETLSSTRTTIHGLIPPSLIAIVTRFIKRDDSWIRLPRCKRKLPSLKSNYKKISKLEDIQDKVTTKSISPKWSYTVKLENIHETSNTEIKEIQNDHYLTQLTKSEVQNKVTENLQTCHVVGDIVPNRQTDDIKSSKPFEAIEIDKQEPQQILQHACGTSTVEILLETLSSINDDNHPYRKEEKAKVSLEAGLTSSKDLTQSEINQIPTIAKSKVQVIGSQENIESEESLYNDKAEINCNTEIEFTAELDNQPFRNEEEDKVLLKTALTSHNDLSRNEIDTNTNIVESIVQVIGSNEIIEYEEFCKDNKTETYPIPETDCTAEHYNQPFRKEEGDKVLLKTALTSHNDLSQHEIDSNTTIGESIVQVNCSYEIIENDEMCKDNKTETNSKPETDFVVGLDKEPMTLILKETTVTNSPGTQDSCESPPIKIFDDHDYAVVSFEAAKNIDLKSCSGIVNTAKICLSDKELVLNGAEINYPEIGTYYFPIDSINENSNEDLIEVVQEVFDDAVDNVIDDDVNEDNLDMELSVLLPKYTYAKMLEPETNVSLIKRGRLRKRKLDMTDVKYNVKKYRKGKNIDYPKITKTAMKDSAYSAEYKCVLDYMTSVKFSYNSPFHKEYIDVLNLQQNWPIDSTYNVQIEDITDVENCLFTEFEKKLDSQRLDPMKITLVEEISSNYEDEEYACSEQDTKNFSMGFGDGSGRVINISKDDGNTSEISAATLSDVKQSQPLILNHKDEDFANKTKKSQQDEYEKMERYIKYIQIKDKVRNFFEKTTIAFNRAKIHGKTRSNGEKFCKNLLQELCEPYFIEPPIVEAVINVVQVGQSPVSAAAQNPMTCDPRVTQVSNASPSQCSIENSPNDDSQSGIKTEYTELTTAELTNLPLMSNYTEQSQIMSLDSDNVAYMQSSNNITQVQNSEIIPQVQSSEESHVHNTESFIQSSSANQSHIENSDNIDNGIEVNTDCSKNIEDNKEKIVECKQVVTDKQMINENNANHTEYAFNTNAFDDSVFDEKRENTDPLNKAEQQNGTVVKTDQLAHAMNAAGITTTPEPSSETVNNNQTHLVNILSQNLHHVPSTTQASANNFTKTTSINAMALQQALAQILPQALNQNAENNQNVPISQQVLHIVQSKNGSGNQITLLDNSQQSVINNQNTPVLHIVQNSGAPLVSNSGTTNVQHTNSFSGLSLVDTGLQQGGNQLLHIVNTGNQKNNNAGQVLKRVNLLTNLTNMQGSNEQKMVQFVCKSADGKSIQLNAQHQRSMVLRLQPIETNIQTTSQKAGENEEIAAGSNNENKETNSQQEIKSRSVYEENYAKFIQNTAEKPAEKSNSLPKFNQAFGKPVYQDGNQKPSEINTNSPINAAISNNTSKNNNSSTSDNSINLDQINQISSPPLLLRKSPAQTPQAQPNLVQQIKQTIAPMNIQTMHGGVIYTRQIPVNIGGGQTINLITVPSTELIDDQNQKPSLNQGEADPSIIKIIPQNQAAPTNAEATSDENKGQNHGDNLQNPQPQPVLTQMRIKLPMLSKAPNMVAGTRLVRPSFFQIQRNVIGGANQPVYQQLVLTAAPPLGQQTVRLPQTQTRPLKVPSENSSSSESQMSSSTLEQLREFDMVLEQVKERSTVQPNGNSTTSFNKIHTTSTDTTDSSASLASSTSAEGTQQVLYSIGNNQSLNVAYVSRKSTTNIPTTSTFSRSPDSTGNADSPSSSSHVQVSHTATSESTSSESSVQPRPAKVGSRSRSRPKSSSHPSSSVSKINNVPPKTSTSSSAQKPLEDEQTTQRILYILAEYKEQVENSPDKDKPAPRRRSHPPSNPGSSKRKKSGSRRSGGRDSSPVQGDDTRTMGSEDSSCGTSQGDCTENCLDSHSPQDSPRKVARKLTFDQDTSANHARPQPQRNVIVADGQTITVARGTAGKPATAVLMPANYILPVSMVKGGQQIAIVTNRGPKLLTVGGGEGTTNALLLQRLIGPAGLKPVLRPAVRHVRLPTAALHNLQAFNLSSTATTVQPPDSTASPAPAPTPPELIDTRANSSPWTERDNQDVKPERGSSPEGSEPWHLPSSADYNYEETVRTDNLDRTVLDDAIQDRYSPDMEAQRIFDKMFELDSKKSYILDSHDDSPRCGYDIDASDDDKGYQVVHRKEGNTQRHHKLTHVSAAALRHKYAILEHELRLQKSLSEECEDLGVDSPSAAELFPEAELLFAASPAQDQNTQDNTQRAHTPPAPPMASSIPLELEDQIARDGLVEPPAMLQLGLSAVDHEEFARAHPNTTFHSEPTDEEAQPFTITGFKGRHITSTIFHAGRAPSTVLMTAPQTTVISQATNNHTVPATVKYSDIDNMINSMPTTHNNINLASVLVKDDRLTRFDSIMNDNRELHLSNTPSAIIHSTGNATQVIRRVRYDKDKPQFLLDDPDAMMSDDTKMAEDSSRDATMESIADRYDGQSSPERHTELFWESNSERSDSRRPIDYSSDSDKCCKSPSLDETNSTDSSGIGAHMRLDSVIKEARNIDRSCSAESSAEDTHPPLRTYPPKRIYHNETRTERSLSGKTRAGESSPDNLEVRRRASVRGVVKRGCHCCNGSPAPPRPKKSRPRKPNQEFTN